jgi:hypothetical protein
MPEKKPRAKKTRRWSQRVTRESNALDLERGVFAMSDPLRIAKSLKRSAERSRRRKSSPYRSAMSMLTFYLNRAGRKLPKTQRARIEAAKDELRDLYGKPRTGRTPIARRRTGKSTANKTRTPAAQAGQARKRGKSKSDDAVSFR